MVGWWVGGFALREFLVWFTSYFDIVARFSKPSERSGLLTAAKRLAKGGLRVCVAGMFGVVYFLLRSSLANGFPSVCLSLRSLGLENRATMKPSERSGLLTAAKRLANGGFAGLVGLRVCVWGMFGVGYFLLRSSLVNGFPLVCFSLRSLGLENRATMKPSERSGLSTAAK